MAAWLVWTISSAPISSRIAVAELDHFMELVGGVDMQQGERKAARVKRLLRQAQHHGRILADGIQHHRPGKLGHHLAKNMDALRLQRPQMWDTPGPHEVLDDSG